MAFDSGMLRCVCAELNDLFCGAKVEKVLQPEKDEVNLVLHKDFSSKRLLISASGNNPRICITSTVKENPENAYMLCMLLRKHLIGARLEAVEQIGFERVARLSFDCGDELGYRRKRYIYLEIMGRSSTMVFCDENDKILATTRLVDMTASASRKLLPGITYSLPEAQDKLDPTDLTREIFIQCFTKASSDTPASSWLVSSFMGISPLIAREVVFSACRDCDSTLGSVGFEKLYDSFSDLMKKINAFDFSPCVLYKADDSSKAFEFSFTSIDQYGCSARVVKCESGSDAIDTFYIKRDAAERKKQHYNDIYTILKNARNRVKKKLVNQYSELEECDKAFQSKKYGNLIMQELYRIKRGDKAVTCTDYSADPIIDVEIPLDTRLNPTQNAQRYYKDYSKKNNARDVISQQILIAQEEEKYIESVFESLERAKSEADYSQIRTELARSGYGKRGVAIKSVDKRKKAVLQTVDTPNGFKLYVGRNNTQNDHISFEIASKEDLWFHVKDYPGAHVLLVTEGIEVPNADKEYAARVAAGASGAGTADKVAVDYTHARYVKKPSGSRPGFVNYFKYTTVYVNPLKLDS